jgi:hypothetical protein
MKTGPEEFDPGDEPVAAAETCDPVDHDDYVDAQSDHPSLTGDVEDEQ